MASELPRPQGGNRNRPGEVLDQPEDKAKEIANAAAKTDGVIFHLWHKDQVIPDGRVTIPQSLGHIFTRVED